MIGKELRELSYTFSAVFSPLPLMETSFRLIDFETFSKVQIFFLKRFKNSCRPAQMAPFSKASNGQNNQQQEKDWPIHLYWGMPDSKTKVDFSLSRL